MASLIREKKKTGVHWRVCYVAPDGSRPSLHLGQVSKTDAETFKANLEKIISAKRIGVAIDPITLAWAMALSDEYADKLSAQGLIPSRESSALKSFLDSHIDSRQDLHEKTRYKMRVTANSMVKAMGERRELRSITPGDCDSWRQTLLNEKKAPATVGKMVKHGRQMFKVAMRKGLIQTNPFADIKGGSQRNDARLFFVAREVIVKILSFCNRDWKAILALTRYGALRCPSEVLSLKWEHVDWQGGKILVQSPKGENHGKPVRPLPLFPELREILWEVFQTRPAGSEYVVHAYRDASNTNLRTQFLRILARAKIPKWERLFHNLRSSRIIELTDRFPLKTVCEWAGNTPDVAMNHYLTSVAEHFQRALTERTDIASIALQKAAYQEMELDGIGCPSPGSDYAVLRQNAENAEEMNLVTTSQAPRQGLEPWT